MLQIVLSLPISSIFYRGLFQIDCFQFLHVLVVCLVLGIGADDISVLVDSFRHVSVAAPPGGGREQLMSILREAYFRSASAIFNTSFTTTMAFLSCSVSGVMPLRTLGWY